MLKEIRKWIFRLEVRMRRSFGEDISTPKGRIGAAIHFQLMDHAILRYLWTNEAEIAPGVFRMNQPYPARIRALKKRGINNILNLRGPDTFAHYLYEKKVTEEEGITLWDRKLYARKAPKPERVAAVFEAFDEIPRPFALHCKSGADRAGFASALFLIDQENVPVAEAKKQLSLRFVHQRYTKTGILDHILDTYEKRLNEKGPIPIRDWFATEYDHNALQKEFDATPMLQR